MSAAINPIICNMVGNAQPGNIMGKRSAIEFYEMLVRTGRIQKGGAAYERLKVLKGTTEQDRINRLNKFLSKRRAKNGKNGRIT